MSLNSTVFRVQYTANGSTFSFGFPYLFLDETHLVVVETNTTTGVDTTKTLTTDYTVTGEGLSAGGTVTFLAAPTSGRVITISRIVPITQLVDYNQSDAFPADTHEQALDKLTMIAQQLNSSGGDVDRSIRYRITEPAGYTAELPDAASRAGKVISFDVDGEMTVTQELGSWAGDWATATEYNARDLVRNAANRNVYIVVDTYTSGATIAADIGAGSLELIFDAATSEANAAASAAAALVSENNAAASESAAELAETNAETAETNAEAAQLAAEAAQLAAETARTGAETAETNAETAETNAETAETNAEAAQLAAEAAQLAAEAAASSFDVYDIKQVGTASGTDTYTVGLTPALTAYATGQQFVIKFTNANTGAATLNVDSLGAKSIQKNSSALVAGDIPSNSNVHLVYDGTNMQMIGSPSGGTGGGSVLEVQVFS